MYKIGTVLGYNFSNKLTEYPTDYILIIASNSQQVSYIGIRYPELKIRGIGHRYHKSLKTLDEEYVAGILTEVAVLPIDTELFKVLYNFNLPK